MSDDTHNGALGFLKCHCKIYNELGGGQISNGKKETINRNYYIILFFNSHKISQSKSQLIFSLCDRIMVTSIFQFWIYQCFLISVPTYGILLLEKRKGTFILRWGFLVQWRTARDWGWNFHTCTDSHTLNTDQPWQIEEVKVKLLQRANLTEEQECWKMFCLEMVKIDSLMPVVLEQQFLTEVGGISKPCLPDPCSQNSRAQACILRSHLLSTAFKHPLSLNASRPSCTLHCRA